MPINASPQYQKAEEEYHAARTNEEKLAALKKMLQLAPKHKGAESLLAEIKSKISKLKSVLEKQKQQKKGGYSPYSIKREGAAQIVLAGTTNTGKSTLLKELTNANVEIAAYQFTTKKPEIGIMDYHGVKLQVIEVPSITENFHMSPNGPTFLSIIRHSDLIILFFKTPREKAMLDKELSDVKIPVLIYNNQKNIKDEIWKRLNLIKVYTKQPGKKKDFPPIAMEKNSTIKDIASKIHKDFIRNFKYARIYGNSAKFEGQTVGLNHQLEDDDVVELHMK